VGCARNFSEARRLKPRRHLDASGHFLAGEAIRQPGAIRLGTRQSGLRKREREQRFAIEFKIVAFIGGPGSIMIRKTIVRPAPWILFEKPFRLDISSLRTRFILLKFRPYA
jgi:hypothetical protein